MPRRFDVVVVGAGLAGLQVAGWLAERGVRVALLDAKTDLTRAIHTTGIFVRRTFEDYAFPPDCLGPAIRHVSLYSPGRRSVDLVSRRNEFRVGDMGRLYAALLERACTAGVEWFPGARFVDSQQRGERSTIVFDQGGRQGRMECRFLIGCDGAQSRVAEQLGLSRNRQWIVGWEEVYRDVPLVGPPRMHCFLDPVLAPGYIAWWVHDGHEAHLGVGGYPARFRPRTALERFREQVARQFRLGEGTCVEQRGGRIPVGGILPRIAQPRGLLIGDAAGAVSPLTAGGLDPCLRQAELAVQVTEATLAGDRSALQAYRGQSFRRRFAGRRFLRWILSMSRHPVLLELPFLVGGGQWLKPLAERVFFGNGSFPIPSGSNVENCPVQAGDCGVQGEAGG